MSTGSGSVVKGRASGAGGPIAQGRERSPDKREGGGSIPPGPTNDRRQGRTLTTSQAEDAERTRRMPRVSDARRRSGPTPKGWGEACAARDPQMTESGNRRGGTRGAAGQPAAAHQGTETS